MCGLKTRALGLVSCMFVVAGKKPGGIGCGALRAVSGRESLRTEASGGDIGRGVRRRRDTRVVVYRLYILASGSDGGEGPRELPSRVMRAQLVLS